MSDTCKSPCLPNGHWLVRRHSLLLSTLLLILAGPLETRANETGQETREPWSTSKVHGFPDPLPPFQVERTYKQLTFDRPLGIWQVPETKTLLVVEHHSDWGGPGKLFAFQDDEDASLSKLVLERPEIIYGLAFSPDFPKRPFIYVGCNGTSDVLSNADQSVIATRVLRFEVTQLDPLEIDPQSSQLVIEWPSNGHNGGDLVFGNDKMLYVTAGDGTSDSDMLRNGQDLSTIPGSVIRIDVSEEVGDDQPYRTPDDNPFVQYPNARPEIWAYGLRNPWRITFDQASDRLWVGNNGQDAWESVHLIRRGENYGWSVTEGSHDFQSERDQGPTPIVTPTAEHPHSEARSLTGGIVYRGNALKSLVGAYIYGDYSTGNIWSLRLDAEEGVTVELIARSSLQITGFGIDQQRELIVVDHGGGLYKLVPQAEVADASPFPRKLSETGLFHDTAQQVPAKGVRPYEVNSPLWSDGARKQRWLAVPDLQQIGFKPQLGMEFPSGSVLVKTFELPIANETNNRSNWKRIETRLMVKEGKEWFGYSYRWNDQQTDAQLVSGEGREEALKVLFQSDENQESFNEPQELLWSYPSRTSCMVCHSRAANYVLGFSTPQLNRSSDGDDRSSNQLESLCAEGWFDVDSLPKPVDEYGHLINPSDEHESIEKRARSYLHANCSYCHVKEGGGNSLIDLSFNASLEGTRLLNETPLHTAFGLEGAKLIFAGEPQRSVLWQRITRRSTGQMPPLASRRVDPLAAELIAEWIESLAEQADE